MLCLGIFGRAADAVGWSAGTGHRSFTVRADAGTRVGFTGMKPGATGLDFTNLLRGDAYLTNAVAHNGAGVAIGDIDGDGWADIYLCSLEAPNRLYRNLGGWKFQEIPLGDAACLGQISTGACFADVDGDGDLDLLVNGIAAGTRLFLNDGKGSFTERKDSGLSRTASATSMALADIDGDGDLDLYCTHFIDAMLLADPTTRFAVAKRGEQWEVSKVNGESTRSPRWAGRFEATADGKVRELPEVHGLYRNDGKGRFTAIQDEPGTFMDEQGKPVPPFRDWGLAVMFRDIDRDGFPDLYVCNDNTSPDRIWINTGKGTFRLLAPGLVRHTSRSSMGVDFADIDRDGNDDFFVVDMLARDHAKRMTQLVRDRPAPAELELPDARPQFNRNTLFFGRPDGSFSESAFMAGVAATDWTWTAVFLDVDLDGYEDLLFTNGFEFDVMDQDSSNEIKTGRRRFTDAQLKRSMQMHPRWRTKNGVFRNKADGTFEPAGERWGFAHEGISYGMALGDLDNDGDLDLVVNNLNEPAGLYRNDASAGRVQVRLRGKAPNTQGIGARIQLTGGPRPQAQEMIAGGRYLSGDQPVRVFAAPRDSSSPLRIEVAWRDGSKSVVDGVEPDRVYEINEAGAVSRAASTAAPKPAPMFADVSDTLGQVHSEDSVDDWAAQEGAPRRLSRQGPGISWTDLDGDGWDDLCITGGAGGGLAVYHNEGGHGFKKMDPAAVVTVDQSAAIGWPDGIGGRRLLVAAANHLTDGAIGTELLSFAATNLAEVRRTPAGAAVPGPMASADIDGDGDLDLFIGGRFQHGRYPEAVSSSVWTNDQGRLVLDKERSGPFAKIGLVAGATFVDLDDDGAPDLALAMEWGPVRIFHNDHGKFRDVTETWGLSKLTGWWTGIAAGDFDGDGRMDLVCGNRGRNTVHELHRPGPERLFYGALGGDGAFQVLEAWRLGDAWMPSRDRTALERVFPDLRTQFPKHEAFGSATVQDLLGAAFGTAANVEAGTSGSMVFLNRGGRFEARPLPREAQLAPVFSVNVGDLDGDGFEDVFCSQNRFGTMSDISRDDDGRGLWLRGNGDGSFTAVDASVSGIRVPGEQRGAALADFDHDGRTDIAVSQNNSRTKLYANRGAKPGLRVVLQGPAANPDAVGASVRLVYADGREGPRRAVTSGTGFASQDSATQILGRRSPATGIRIRWPDGRDQVVPLSADLPEIRVRPAP